MRYPNITDDGTIIFTYEEDFRLLSPGQFSAQKLTRHPGNETQAKFSPDGKQVAFIASYDGKKDLYIMSLSDLKPRRITYSPAEINLMDWSSDGNLFITRRFSGCIMNCSGFPRRAVLPSGFPPAGYGRPQ